MPLKDIGQKLFKLMTFVNVDGRQKILVIKLAGLELNLSRVINFFSSTQYFFFIQCHVLSLLFLKHIHLIFIMK